MSFLSYRTPPKVADKSALELERKTISESSFYIGNNWLRKNRFGVWEARLSGKPFEIGAKYGILAKELIQQQEIVFVNDFSKAVPNKLKQFFLKHLIGLFNRKLDKHIPIEYLLEIYGGSFANSREFNSIAPAYLRVLNYHAAHDIGHALNDYQLVGCTSFSVKGSKTKDGQIISGRNFDFYSGDEFAKTKVISFFEPEQGHKFASLSWPGFSGVVSGMNVEGLTVTMNAAKSTLPRSSKTPISLLGRELLQYASNIEEAIALANKRDVFVSETIMVNSAKDNATVLIEKAPKQSDSFLPQQDVVVCANHFQSDRFASSDLNLENIEQSDSIYRFNKMKQLLNESEEVSSLRAADILRDRNGTNGEELGNGNPRAINQLIAHHSIIFQPGKLMMWISTEPWQVGEYLCYDLNKVFNLQEVPTNDIDEASYLIPADPFIKTKEYHDFITFRNLKFKINDFIYGFSKSAIDEHEEITFVNSNPNYYEAYMILGMYFKKLKQYEKAKVYFHQSLDRIVSSKEEEEKIKALIKKCK